MFSPLFPFLCVCHLSDNSPSSPLAFPHYSYSYNTNNKDIHLGAGGHTQEKQTIQEQAQGHHRSWCVSPSRQTAQPVTPGVGGGGRGLSRMFELSGLGGGGRGIIAQRRLFKEEGKHVTPNI